MKLAILTVQRNPPYLSDTLSSLCSSAKNGFSRVTLFPGDAEPIAAAPEYWRVPLDASELRLIGTFKHVADKMAYNYYRTMLNYDEPVCICEDDVQFSKGWWDVFQKAISVLSVPDYLLTLFSAYKTDLSIPVVQPETTPFGTVFIYYAGQSLQRIRDLVWEERLKYFGSHTGIDICIRKVCKRSGIPIFTTTYSLVQHIGKVSTGCQGTEICPTSPVFIDDCVSVQ